MARTIKKREKKVVLVTTEILPPHKAGEVFSVSEEAAAKLLNAHGSDQFGNVWHPKVRLFNEDRDSALLLNNNVLNQEEHYKLLKRLHPELLNEDEYEIEGDDDDLQSSGVTEFDQIVNTPVSSPTKKRGRGRPKGSTKR